MSNTDPPFTVDQPIDSSPTPVRDRLLRLSQVMEIVGLRRTRIYALVKLGEFPAPCKPGGSASRWSENAVLAWVANCTAAKSA